MMSYTKLDHGITESTIWYAPDTTRLVWITMLSMADQHGYVGASIPGLAGKARVPLPDCLAALESFLGPDEFSRTKDFEGRRIAVAEGGWVLLNHAKYLAKQSAEDRRERARVAMANIRANRKQQKLTVNKRKHALTPVTSGDDSLPVLPHVDVDVDVDVPRAKKDQKRVAPTALDLSSWPKEPCPQVLADWLDMRKRRKASNSVTALTTIGKELHKAAASGLTVDACLSEAVTRNWTGFQAHWMDGKGHAPANGGGGYRPMPGEI